MTNSDPSHSRRRLYVQVAVVVLLVLAAFVRPRIQPWLDANFPELAATLSDSTDNSVTAESDAERTSPSVTEETTGPLSTPAATDSDTETGVSTRQQADTRLTSTTTRSPAADRRSGASTSRESGDEPPPGELKPIGKNVFRSSAGLIYRPGSREGHRLKHILKHAEDDLQKPVHGVFAGDRDAILRWIDLAWIQAKAGGKRVRKRNERGRTAWTVNLQEKIGFVGGKRGRSKNQPACRYLRLVLEEDGKTVVTAYPVSSF